MIVCVYIIAIIIYIESLMRKNTFHWILKYPLNFGTHVLVFLSMVLLLSLFITVNISLILVTGVLLILGLANKYKMMFRGDYYYPWDLALGRESSNMTSYLNLRSLVLDIIQVLILMGLSLFFEVRLTVTESIAIIFLGTVILMLSYLKHDELPCIKQHRLYDEKGILLAFILNIKEWIYFKKNGNQSENQIGTIQETSDNKPNIIVIMNESFWNPENLPKVQFSKQLTPTLNSIKSECLFGKMVSPEFGGGTSNIEYEILSGQSMYSIPTGMMAFNACLKNDIYALPRLLVDSGYKTLGVHPYKKWFWDREKAYKHLGFQSFITEEAFQNEIKGDYISDLAFSRKVIDIYKNSNDPLFLYGVTMQNHGPYYEERYDSYDIEVTAPLTEKELGELRCYAQGIYDGDQALNELIDFFRKEKNHTYIIFLGDHLPMLGKQFSIYEKCDYVNSRYVVDWSEEERFKMHSTPFLIWSNHTQESEYLGYVSPAKIGDMILDLTSTNRTAFYQTVHELYKNFPVINKRIG